MISTYRAAFRVPGSRSFSAASFVMRLPMAIYPLGLVLIVSARTGHYGFAGALTGLFVVANGIGNPVLARVVDRVGQGRLLLPASAVHVLSSIVLGMLIQAKAADWTFVLPTIVAGFTYLPVSSLVRARWSYALAGRPELSTAYSFESAIEEVIYTVGPLIASVLATQLDPLWVLVVSILLVAIGAVWLRAQRATEPPAQPEGTPPHPSPLRSPGMVLLCIAALGMGAMFASAEVASVAFCGQHGHRSLTGLVIAALSAGSAIAGFGYGARHHAAPILDRFRQQALVFAVLPALLFAALNVGVLVVCTLIVGVCIAPCLITAFGVIESIVPGPALTEGLAWLVTGISVGYGAGSSVVGAVADHFGARAGYGVTVGAGLLVGTAALVLHARLRTPTPGTLPVA